RVGDVVERVPGAEGAQPAGSADDLLKLLERLRLVKPGRRVGVIPRPVPELAHLPTVAPLPRHNLDSSRWPNLSQPHRSTSLSRSASGAGRASSSGSSASARGTRTWILAEGLPGILAKEAGRKLRRASSTPVSGGTGCARRLPTSLRGGSTAPGGGSPPCGSGRAPAVGVSPTA